MCFLYWLLGSHHTCYYLLGQPVRLIKGASTGREVLDVMLRVCAGAGKCIKNNAHANELVGVM